MKVLVVDDQEDSRLLLNLLLREWGYDVETRADGLEALDAARAGPPDLIISDVMMPRMDGFTFCRQVNDDERLKLIPFVFYTAIFTDQRDEDLAMALGAVRYLQKPMKAPDLRQTLADILAEQSRGRPAGPEHFPGNGPDLERRYADALARKLDDMAQDVERERMARRESEEQYRSILGLSQVAIVEEYDGALVFANEAALDLIGVDNFTDVLGTSVQKWIHPDSLDLFRRATAGPSADGGAPWVEIVLLTRAGGGIDVEVMAAPAGPGGPSRRQFVIRQIAERKKRHALVCFNKLSRRERQIMAMLVQGETNKVVAHHLDISEKTVETHRGHLMKKMEATSLAELIRKAHLVGLRH